jgi:lipopolysaccharide transport system permease protein
MMKIPNPFLKLFKHRDLIVQFTKRELQMRHKGSKLGHTWAFISPLMMLGLYFFVFGVVFGGRFGVLPKENFFDFGLALFLGLTLFNMLADTIAASPSLILNQPNFVKKVVFPLEIIPFAQVCSCLYQTLTSIAIILVLAPFSHGVISWHIFYLPLLILPLVMIALGISWALSAIGVFVRDIAHLTAFITTAVMYASAIVYSPTRIPPAIWVFLKYNPILVIIDLSRSTILWNTSLNFYDLGYIYFASTFTLFAGYFIFYTLRPFFAEVI